MSDRDRTAQRAVLTAGDARSGGGRTGKAAGALLAAVSLVVAGAGGAYADGLASDGDGAAVFNNSDLAFGEVCAGETVSASVPIRVVRGPDNGELPDSKTFRNGSQVGIGEAGRAGAGLSQQLPADKTTVAIPSGWSDVAAGSVTRDAVVSTVTLSSTVVGAFTGSITYRASGTNNQKTPSELIRDDVLNVTATIKDCTPSGPGADTSPPVLGALPAGLVVEATSADGAVVTYDAPTATDDRDASPSVSCLPASGSSFPLGTTAVSCTATDAAGNTSEPQGFDVLVQDTTGPVLGAMPADQLVEATSGAGATVTYALPTATDAVDSDPVVACLPASGATFALGTTTVVCEASDAAGNTGAAKTFDVTVQDTTAPTGVTFSTDGVVDGGSYLRRTVPAAPTCTATDAVTEVPTCVVTGYQTDAGTHVLTATATDDAGNTATATLTYTVRTLTISAFAAPVDGNGVLNVVKGGSTVPLKFTVHDGAVERTDVAVVQGLASGYVTCTSARTDEVEEFATAGSTSLRYADGHFIQNWKTPTGAGKCLKVVVTTIDGSVQTALFKLK